MFWTAAHMRNLGGALFEAEGDEVGKLRIAAASAVLPVPGYWSCLP